MSDWIKWHKDGRGFTYKVTVTSKGVIIVNYRLTKTGNVRRELILMPKRSKHQNEFFGKVIFEEYYSKFEIDALIQALRDLSSIQSSASKPDITREIEKVIVHLSFLKKLLEGGD